MLQRTSTTEIYQPVETKIGYLDVRGAIFLLNASFDRPTLVLEGGISGLSATNAKAEWYHFNLVFEEALAVQTMDLESWSQQEAAVRQNSSFDEVLDSQWYMRLRGKATSDHRHFCVLTHEDVFEVLCRSYCLSLSDGRSLEG